MKRLPLALLLSLLALPFACGGDDEDGDSSADSMNDSADSNPGDQTSSSMETCMTDHSCLNGVCMCETPGKQGQACTDDERCREECEVCM